MDSDLIKSQARALAARSSGDKNLERPLIAGKDLLWLAYLYPLRFLAAILPSEAVRLMSKIIEPFCQLTTWRHKRRLRTLLSQALNRDPSDPEVCRIASRYISNAVMRVIDDLIMDRLLADGRQVRVQLLGRDNLESALAAGRGAIVVSGHFYATRLAKRYLAKIGYHMLSVRNQMPVDPAAGRLGRMFLEPRYVNFLHGIIRDEVFIQDEECSFKIFKRLQLGGLVNILFDAPYSQITARYPFLGTGHTFSAGFLRIAKLSGSPLIPMLCVGNSENLTIVFEEPVCLEMTSNKDELVATNLPKFVKILEKQILEHPDQWESWIHI